MLGKLSRASLPEEVREFVVSVRVFLDNLETIMRQPSSVERGQQIGEQANLLEMAVDHLEHFGITDKCWLRSQIKKLEARHAANR